MKSYNYILFDWDGCLAHSLPFWLNAVKVTLAEYNILLSDADIVNKAFHEWDVNLPKLGITDLPTYGGKVYQIIDKTLEQVLFHDQVKETLKELKKKNKSLAIVTSSNRTNLMRMLEILSAKEFFDVIITADDVIKKKPNAEPLEKAIKELGADKEKTLIIGDSHADILAGHNAGIDCIWFHPKENELFYETGCFDHLNPTYTIKEMKELIKIVK